MMDKSQLKALVSDILQDADMFSENAVSLLLETAAVESKLGHYIAQVGGPALGIFQMEPESERDIWENYIKYRFPLKNQLGIYGYHQHSADRLIYDLRYQILMARIHYRRVKETIPGTVEGRAQYWKDHYNTVLGKGTVSKYLDAAVKYLYS